MSVSLYPENKYNGNPRNYTIDETTYMSVFILYKNSKKELKVSSIINKTKDYFVYLYYKSSYSEFGGNYFIINKHLYKINDVQNKYKTSSIIITHDIKCALSTANRIIMLKEGEVYMEGKVGDFTNSDEPMIKSFFA